MSRLSLNKQSFMSSKWLRDINNKSRNDYLTNKTICEDRRK